MVAFGRQFTDEDHEGLKNTTLLIVLGCLIIALRTAARNAEIQVSLYKRVGQLSDHNHGVFLKIIGAVGEVVASLEEMQGKLEE